MVGLQGREEKIKRRKCSPEIIERDSQKSQRPLKCCRNNKKSLAKFSAAAKAAAGKSSKEAKKFQRWTDRQRSILLQRESSSSSRLAALATLLNTVGVIEPGDASNNKEKKSFLRLCKYNTQV